MNKRNFMLLFLILSIFLVGCEEAKYPTLQGAEYKGYQNEQTRGRYETTVDLIFEYDGNEYILRGYIKDKDLLVKGSIYNVQYDDEYHELIKYDFAKKKPEELTEV